MFCLHESKHPSIPKLRTRTILRRHSPTPNSQLCCHRNPAFPIHTGIENKKAVMLGTACRSSWNTGNLDFPKTFFFQICRLDGGFLILILSYVASPQCRTIFQVSHSVSASSAPYRLSDALNRHIPGLKSTLLLRSAKKLTAWKSTGHPPEGLRTPCDAIWPMDLTFCCRKEEKTCLSP